MAKKYKINQNGEITLRQAFDKFMAVKEAQGIGDETNYDYQMQVGRFIKESHNTTEYDILEADTLNFFAEIPDTSPARYNKPYQYITAFFSWMEDKEIVSRNPIKANKLKKRKDEGKIKPVPFDDIAKMLKVINRKGYTGLRDFAIIYCMIDTGIRTKELLSLHVSDYDPDAKRLVVPPTAAKTKESRILYLSTQTCQLLNEVIRQHDESWTDKWLLPNYEGHRLVTSHLDKKFREYSERAGVKITPYQLRHTFATGFLVKGGSELALQKQMGHADLRMTKRYVELSEEFLKEQHKSFSPLSELQTKRKK